MALTYQWSQAMSIARSGFSKKVPTSDADQILLCNMVNSEMWTAHPWRQAKTTIAPGSTPLVDGDQDYNSPIAMFRPLKLSLVRTDTTPDQHRELEVRQELDVDLVKRSPYSIKAAGLQAGVGRIRLEAAVQITSPETWEIQGEYHRNPEKITKLDSDMWFEDHWFHVPVHGLLYWLKRQSDDPDAETQYALFRAGIEQMWRAEDYGATDGFFPSEALGAGRGGATSIYPGA